MQYWDDLLYPSFMATIRGEYYGVITQDLLDEEFYHLTCHAIAAFKFPRISTNYETFYAVRSEDGSTLNEVDPELQPEAIPHGAFLTDITPAEVEVILAWMKVYWYQNLLANSDNFEDIYTDANIKTFSRANAVEKNTNLYKEALAFARDIETRYSRTSSERRPTIGKINADE